MKQLVGWRTVVGVQVCPSNEKIILHDSLYFPLEASAAGDKLLPILSCDVIGISCSMPVLRSEYSTSSGGKDIGVVTVVVVGLAAGAVLGL